MLSNLIYISQRNSNCTEEEISKILEVCHKNNSHKDITGVLLYSNDMFLQYLEGDGTKIFDLYSKIREDNRHSDAVMVSGDVINDRVFPTWSMAKKNIGKQGFEIISGGGETDKEHLDRVLEEQENGQLVNSIKKFFK